MLDPRLRHVMAVAKGGSFTAAAEIAGVTQSAVTRSVADLEREIGYPIFRRSSRGAFLTDEGVDFVERLARLLDDTGELLRRPHALDPYVGALRVGVCPSRLEEHLAAPVERVLARHPMLRLNLSSSSFERMVQQLRDGEVDVAVGMDAAFSVWPDIRRTLLASIRAAVFVRRGHPLLERSSVTVSDLAEFDFVTPSDSRPYGATIRNIYENQGLESARHIHVVDYFPTARRIVAKTNAIGSAALSHTLSDDFQERFAVIEGVSLFDRVPMCCAVRSTSEPTRAAKAFILACVETFPVDERAQDQC